MSVIDLKVKKREIGKSRAKKYRREGLVPGVYYFRGQESIPILSDPLSLRPVIFTSAMRIINLQIEGDSEPRECILRDVKFDPVTDDITHFDVMGIKRGEKLYVEVPVVLKGTPKGERSGGITQHILRRVMIYCFPKDLPEQIEFDVSDLELHESFTLDRVSYEDVEFDAPPDTVVAACVPPKLTEEILEAEAAEAEAEEEEMAEGEAPAEGEEAPAEGEEE